MNQGVRSTDQWREHRALLEAISRNREDAATAVEAPPQSVAVAPQAPEPEAEPAIEPASSWQGRVTAAVLLVAAAIWIVAVGTSVEADGSPLTRATALISLASGPLALLGVIFIVLQRSSRKEAARFGQTAQAMRAESALLESVIGRLADRISESRKDLADQAQQLMSLGDDTALRLSEIAAAMGRETRILRAESDNLETAAEIARSDLGVLIDDLPRMDEQVRGISDRLRQTAGEAGGRVDALQAQLAALETQSEKADQAASGAARQLAEQIARIDEQGARIDARMAEAATALAARIEDMGSRIDSLAGGFATRNAESQAAIDAIARSLDEIEARFAGLSGKGNDAVQALIDAVGRLREQSEGLADRLATAAPATEALVERAAALKSALDASTAGIGSDIPAALAGIEAQAGRSHAAITALLPEASALERALALATGGIADAGQSLADQRAVIEDMHRIAGDRLAEVRTRSEELQASLAQAEDSAKQLAEKAGPQLVEALLRVRETAVQTADHARETIGTVIPSAATDLGAAARDAIEKAMREALGTQLEEVATAADRAVSAATSANERLQQQLLAIRDTAAAVDARIDEVQAQVAEADEESFSRRAALLVESLNSTAIDIAKILSNDVTDSAWTSYLKGDRSIFTRRAVRLLDTAESKEIVRHYEEEPEFREQVNRYVHDFEAMLRRVLAQRDGAPLSVTLLSSDMGKLYVALAQAIERLRA
ncbi:hypothetical protein [Edaphosphingomonas haloaromaticamans]|uniref:Chromosome partition protein Smc n=1 Tax=Edaphosphingomonas haloaromaticamans TaxID=653954 RepID=A0A1S1HCE4_9SPHN|nr:hypothetical protein [Sphingomonas haloaromaticamans]OHT19864.1 Chromosome partition protein Smc [Sphingomonas haloaromaticamans]